MLELVRLVKVFSWNRRFVSKVSLLVLQKFVGYLTWRIKINVKEQIINHWKKIRKVSYDFLLNVCVSYSITLCVISKINSMSWRSHRVHEDYNLYMSHLLFGNSLCICMRFTRLRSKGHQTCNEKRVLYCICHNLPSYSISMGIMKVNFDCG